MAETRFRLIYPNEGELVFCRLNKRIEYIVNLKKKKGAGREETNREDGCIRGQKVPLNQKHYIDPDVRGLLVDDVRLRAVGHGLHTLLPPSRVVRHGDEEGRGQQHQLEFPLTAVQKRRPAAKETTKKTEQRITETRLVRGAATESVELRDSLFAVARPTHSGDVFRAWKQGGERDGQFFVLCAHNLEANTR